ncbi:MAG: hypothetical protein LBF54_03285 [Holosporaceae bacterium]|jgi:transcriptional regulator of arginine metabolism|nr:hypothetical protein [Holosporaceae bacterium]
MLDEQISEHILDIIRNNEISEQSHLKKKLMERGIDIAQSTLSRKLKKLKITKVSGIYVITEINHYRLPIILNMQISESGIVVLHTSPGEAGGLAHFIDKKYVDRQNVNKAGIIGTIAGDDVVILITKMNSDAVRACELLCNDFPYLANLKSP